MAESFDIEFKGYFTDPSINEIPEESGVYCIYGGVFNIFGEDDEELIEVEKLIYIGESGNLKAEIKGHKYKEDWEKEVKEENQLCYSYALVEEKIRERIEAALIFHHQPPVNTEYKNNFLFENTIIKLEGKIDLLDSEFTVNNTE